MVHLHFKRVVLLTAKISLFDLATVYLICLCKFSSWSNQITKYLASETIEISLLFMINVIGVSFVFRVNITAYNITLFWVKIKFSS